MVSVLVENKIYEVKRMNIFETNVIEYGANAATFKEENMLVLFGKNAPAELADFCYIIDVNPVIEEIKAGDVLALDGIEYKITAVGNVVYENLKNLGHITLNFNGAEEAEVAGTLYLEQKEIAELDKGSVIEIKKAA